MLHLFEAAIRRDDKILRGPCLPAPQDRSSALASMGFTTADAQMIGHHALENPAVRAFSLHSRLLSLLPSSRLLRRAALG